VIAVAFHRGSAAMADHRTRETIALVARTIGAAGPVMEAVGRVGLAARIGLPSLPPIPAFPPVEDGPRALSIYELEELERVGLGLPAPFPAIPLRTNECPPSK
jgi:hypothetical protein